MALASGVPVPPVYVLDHEPGINAFAAGHQPGDAVVAVSAGCLEYLTREELQGVMGHEFSHILNGDMRLNLRLIGIVYGILVLAIIGYYVHALGRPRFVARLEEKRRRGAAIFFLGLALVILGYLGVFFGKLIKSAIIRQREFLADASSVQFTRNPGGIAGALKKIGGLAEGSRIRDAHAEEISHMFFGDAFAGSLFNLFATHPPLVARIRALEPEFDGRFPAVQAPLTAKDADTPRRKTPIRLPIALPAWPVQARPQRSWRLDAGQVVQNVGRPQTEHLDHAGRIVGGMPPPLLDAAREPFSAQAVIFSLLLNRGKGVGSLLPEGPEGCSAQKTTDPFSFRQLQVLQGAIPPALFQEVQQLAGLTQSLPAASRLPLVS